MATGPFLKILVAEDEAPLRNLIRLSLEAGGHTVIAVGDGEAALDSLKREDVHLVILDIMMPKMDGFTACQEIRKHSDVPIMMLTALGNIESIVRGFELGADDYITKPFAFKEVDVRVQAIMRRYNWAKQGAPEDIITIGRVTLDVEAHEVRVDGRAIHLTPTEFELLRYLMTHDGETIAKEELFKDVWGYEFVGGTNLVEVAIRRLREKIEINPSKPEYILTVRGVGYRFRDREQGEI